MKRVLAITTVGCLAATGAMAQGFEGATIRFDYFLDQTGFSQEIITGSAEFGLSGDFSLQVDASMWGYTGFQGFGEFYGVTLHGVYDLPSGAALGGFVTYEDWSGDRYYFAGLEAAQEFDGGSLPIRLEGFAGYYDYIDGSWSATVVGANAEFAVTDRLGLNAGAVWVSEPAQSGASLMAGANYDFGNGLAASAGVFYDTLFNYTVWSLGLSFDVGGGTTFTPRTWNAIFPLD